MPLSRSHRETNIRQAFKNTKLLSKVTVVHKQLCTCRAQTSSNLSPVSFTCCLSLPLRLIASDFCGFALVPLADRLFASPLPSADFPPCCVDRRTTVFWLRVIQPQGTQMMGQFNIAVRCFCTVDALTQQLVTRFNVAVGAY